MRKIICTLLAVALVLSAGVPTAFAAHHHGGHHGGHNGSCVQEKTCSQDGNCVGNCQFVDEDGDGICDNCENICPDCQEAKDTDGNGICDGCDKCNHFKDENGDGICDHHHTKPQSSGNCGSGSHKHSHHSGRHKHHH